MSNLLNLELVSKSYGVRPLLSEVSLGVGEGDRIGIVGRNGDGKTTLLEVMTGLEEPDSGRVSRRRGLLVGYLHQGDELVDSHSVREAVLGGMADHEWAAATRTREVVEELLAGIPLDRAVAGLSGGERRRCSLAALLLGDHDLMVLDEPTNHLDVEAVAWLAAHLRTRDQALVVVTHDRWFLDEVCQWTWEVHDGQVDVYEGGYAAFTLAKAERQRQASAAEIRRQNLVRKELAWLRRGPPARTSKPKFRIDAANALIADVPPPRDRLELERFATQRLGKDVVDLEDVDLVRGERRLLSHATWRLGPGDRVGVVGVLADSKLPVLDGSNLTGIRETYESSPTVFSASSMVAFAHGLSAAPKNYAVYAVCTTSQAPYVVGDEVLVTNVNQVGGAFNGVSIMADSTNLKARVGPSIPLHTDTGGPINMTIASWQLIVRASVEI